MSDVIAYLTKVRFGHGAVAELGEELGVQGIRSPLVVTDRGLLDTGLVADALARGGVAGAPVFADTPENPTEEAATRALAALRASGADGLVAVGGGSAIDLAKAVALLATHEGPLEPLAAIHGGVSRIGPVLPLVAVPTTAGTGSEVGRGALITLASERKLAFLSPNIIPRAAVCDPQLTLGLPPRLTAATGLDAISHCVETFLSPRFNPPADAIALDGLVRAMAHLPRAVADGGDGDARAAMMMAATEGALAFQKGLGAVHSASHALGGLAAMRLHHGTLNAVLLPHVLEWNAPVAREKYVVIRRVLGLAETTDLAAHFAAFNAGLGLPASLREMGVTADAIDRVAPWAEADHCTATNPRPTSADDFARLMRAAL